MKMIMWYCMILLGCSRPPEDYSHSKVSLSPTSERCFVVMAWRVVEGRLMRLAFGHEKVSILNGGLPRWIDEGNDVEMGELQDIGESEYTGKKMDKSSIRCE